MMIRGYFSKPKGVRQQKSFGKDCPRVTIASHIIRSASDCADRVMMSFSGVGAAINPHSY
jgi:hypothetical protein